MPISQCGGGEVTLAVLVDAWCGMSECPVRFRVETDDGRVVQNFGTIDYDMVCQAFESFTYDPEARALHACAARIALLPEPRIAAKSAQWRALGCRYR